MNEIVDFLVRHVKRLFNKLNQKNDEKFHGIGCRSKLRDKRSHGRLWQDGAS